MYVETHIITILFSSLYICGLTRNYIINRTLFLVYVSYIINRMLFSIYVSYIINRMLFSIYVSHIINYMLVVYINRP